MTRFCVNVKPAKAVQLIEKVCTDNGLQTKRPLSNKAILIVILLTTLVTYLNCRLLQHF